MTISRMTSPTVLDDDLWLASTTWQTLHCHE